MEKPEGKRPLGRLRRRWVDNIRMDLQEVGCGYMDWIGLAQNRDGWRRFVSAVMNLRVPWNAGNFLTSCKPVSFSRRTLHHGVSKYVHGWAWTARPVWGLRQRIEQHGRYGDCANEWNSTAGMGTAPTNGTARSVWGLRQRIEQHGRYGDCATEWKTQESIFNFRNRKDISSFLETSKPAPESTQPWNQWVWRFL